MKLCWLLILSMLFVAQAVFADTYFTVGPDVTDDFIAIQPAIDAAPSGYSIYVADGTYTENLIIAGKELTISGNSLDRNAVKIIGNITIGAKTEVDLQYISLDATGHANGVLLKGDAEIKYGKISGAKNGVSVWSRGELETYDEEISGNSAYGVLCRSGGQIHIDRSNITNNTKSGIRVRKNLKTHPVWLNESILTGNSTGLQIVSTRAANEIYENTFSRNTVGMALLDSLTARRTVIKRNNFNKNRVGLRIKNARVDRDDNTFKGNVKNIKRS